MTATRTAHAWARAAASVVPGQMREPKIIDDFFGRVRANDTRHTGAAPTLVRRAHELYVRRRGAQAGLTSVGLRARDNANSAFLSPSFSITWNAAVATGGPAQCRRRRRRRGQCWRVAFAAALLPWDRTRCVHSGHSVRPCGASGGRRRPTVPPGFRASRGVQVRESEE